MSRKVINTVIKKSNADEFTIAVNLSAEMFGEIKNSTATITNEEALTILGVDFNILNNILLDNRKTKLYLDLVVNGDNPIFYTTPLGVTFIENQAISLVSLGLFDSQYFCGSFSPEEVTLSIQ